MVSQVRVGTLTLSSKLGEDYGEFGILRIYICLIYLGNCAPVNVNWLSLIYAYIARVSKLACRPNMALCLFL